MPNRAPQNTLHPIAELLLVYRSEGTGKYFTQQASDVVVTGTLIDPDGPNAGDDMAIVGYRLV